MDFDALEAAFDALARQARAGELPRPSRFDAPADAQGTLLTCDLNARVLHLLNEWWLLRQSGIALYMTRPPEKGEGGGPQRTELTQLDYVTGTLENIAVWVEAKSEEREAA